MEKRQKNVYKEKRGEEKRSGTIYLVRTSGVGECDVLKLERRIELFRDVTVLVWVDSSLALDQFEGFHRADFSLIERRAEC